MAEDYGVTLKITADTTDLDQIPQKVEESRKEIERPVEQTVEVVEHRRETAAPVEHPAETVKVEEQREPSAPVEHPAETVEIEPRITQIDTDSIREIREIRGQIEEPIAIPVTERRETAAPVEHPAETVKVEEQREPSAPAEHPAETVEVRQDPDPLKPKVEQPAPVKVTADTSAAESNINGFFGRIRSGVTAIRATISSVFAAFGMVTFSVMGVQTLIAGFQKLRDMVTATSRAIAQMRWDSWVGGFNAAADALIGKHQKIIALLKEEQDIANKATSLQTMETSQSRAQEDQARQQVRNVALAGETDPRKRQQLEDRFAAEDDEIARRRFEQDKRSRLRTLDDEESIYRSKENGARAQLPKIDEEIKNQEYVIDIARKSIASGGDKEKNEKYIEEAKKRLAALKDEKKAVEELAEAMKREADYRQAQIKIVEKSSAPIGGGDVRAAEARAQEQRDADAQADFERERGKSAADNDFDSRFRAAQRRASAQGATEQQVNEAENTQLEMLRQRQQEAEEQVAEAEKALAEELRKDAKDRDERRIARARADIREGEQVAAQVAAQRADLEQSIQDRRGAKQEDYFGNLAREIDSQRPQNRLTAMGLGSGDSAASAERQRIIGVLGQILEATRQNRPAPAQPTPVTFTF